MITNDYNELFLLCNRLKDLEEFNFAKFSMNRFIKFLQFEEDMRKNSKNLQKSPAKFEQNFIYTLEGERIYYKSEIMEKFYEKLTAQNTNENTKNSKIHLYIEDAIQMCLNTFASNSHLKCLQELIIHKDFLKEGLYNNIYLQILHQARNKSNSINKNTWCVKLGHLILSIFFYTNTFTGCFKSKEN